MTGKQFATIVVITFIVAMIWLISDIIFNTKASVEVSPKLEALLQPVNPTFNSRILDEIDRNVIDTSLTTPVIKSPPATPSASVAPSATPIPTTRPSASPSPSASPLAQPSILQQPLSTTSGQINL